MCVFLSLVLSASASFQCASQAFTVFSPYIPLRGGVSAPSWVCGRLWLLRLGYYKLTRPKPRAPDWVWIVDHTVQIGPEKCLVIVGIRLSCLPPPCRSLGHADLEPIAVCPVTTSNGAIVCQQLEEATAQTGVPRQIVSDGGSDLQKGIRTFCQTHPDTIWTYDIKHTIALMFKHELEKDAAWQEFQAKAASTKQQVQQTSLAFLAPRNQRTKARYMNVPELIRWGRQLLDVVTQVAPFARQNAEEAAQKGRQHLLKKFGWIREFASQLQEWEEMVTLAEMTEQFVRTEGFHYGASRELAHRFGTRGQTPRPSRFRVSVLHVVAEESAKASPVERLVGSSEVLESLFGKLKHLEGEQAKSGITGLILSLPAMVAPTTEEVLYQAIETTSTQQVLNWCNEHIGRSLQVKRRSVFNTPDFTEQKWDKLVGAS